MKLKSKYSTCHQHHACRMCMDSFWLIVVSFPFMKTGSNNNSLTTAQTWGSTDTETLAVIKPLKRIGIKEPE